MSLVKFLTQIITYFTYLVCCEGFTISLFHLLLTLNLSIPINILPLFDFLFQALSAILLSNIITVITFKHIIIYAKQNYIYGLQNLK